MEVESAVAIRSGFDSLTCRTCPDGYSEGAASCGVSFEELVDIRPVALGLLARSTSRPDWPSVTD